MDANILTPMSFCIWEAAPKATPKVAPEVISGVGPKNQLTHLPRGHILFSIIIGIMQCNTISLTGLKFDSSYTVTYESDQTDMLGRNQLLYQYPRNFLLACAKTFSPSPNKV